MPQIMHRWHVHSSSKSTDNLNIIFEIRPGWSRRLASDKFRKCLRDLFGRRGGHISYARANMIVGTPQIYICFYPYLQMHRLRSGGSLTIYSVHHRSNITEAGILCSRSAGVQRSIFLSLITVPYQFPSLVIRTQSTISPCRLTENKMSSKSVYAARCRDATKASSPIQVQWL